VSLEDLRINADRLNQSLAEMATIGATSAGGVTRLALSDEDRQARQLLIRWLVEIDLQTHVDDVGNMWAVRPGTSTADPVMLGSHLDTVIQGGRYDGALGVLGALEVLRTLHEHNIITDKPIGLVNWTNEEGVRFEPAMTCSGVVTGAFTAEYVHERHDRSGARFGDELTAIGFAGNADERPKPGAYLELHIEQGPVLESIDLPVGMVEGIVGITWCDVTIVGQPDHAGPSPMHLRHDPLMAAAEIILEVERIALHRDDTAVATVGRINVEANVINTIPGIVRFSVDFRHRDPAVLDDQVELLRRAAGGITERRGATCIIDRFWTSAPTPFDPEVLSEVSSAIAALGLPEHRLWSGAGHDARYLADICPSAMIFVRSRAGLSHCEAEFSAQEDIAAGANTLLQTALRLATN
jgi:N-carbamoyl-L-amino-acid hydrolase